MSERTTAELERDAEVARAKVADTAESIRNRMTPGQLIDEFSGLFSGGDGSVALGNLKSQVRDNPLPVALIGAGLAWLMLGNGPAAATPTRSNSRTSASGSFADANDDGSGSFGDRVSGVAEGLESAAIRSVDAVGDMVADAARSAGSPAADSSESVRSQLAEGKKWVEGAAGSATSGAGDFTAKARQSATDLFQSEPLILAVLGMAVGTAIGAMLPRTEIEDQSLGAYSDKVRDTAHELMDKGVEGAKEVAAEAYQTVKDEADRQGIGQAGEASIVEKVAEVVKSTSAKAEETIRDKITPPPA
jgi:hypothetical protein